MQLEGTLGVGLLLRRFRWRVLVTWLLVLVENLLLALIPLFIGRAIDALLEGRAGALFEVAGVMGALVLVAGARRVYDTRAYGTMRVRLGAELTSRSSRHSVSTVNARLGMSRELVDFLEAYVPELLTSLVQVVVSIALLWSFDSRLGLSALAVVVATSVVYALFHRRFYRLNGDLNTQMERQVSILEEWRHESLVAHLMRLRRCEVRVSDTEAVLYSTVFFGMFAFILANLWLASTIPAISAGAIFAILSYSWALVESGIALPLVLQQWSRLSEIQERLNSHSNDASSDAVNA